jgi:hypothetical protein
MAFTLRQSPLAAAGLIIDLQRPGTAGDSSGRTFCVVARDIACGFTSAFAEFLPVKRLLLDDNTRT